MALHWLVATILVTNYFSYLTSATLVFRKYDDRNNVAFWFLIFGSASTWAISIHEMVNAAPMSTVPLVTLLIIEVTCGLIYWWAAPIARKASLTLAFSHDQPKELIKSGPYRLVRHPFYFSYLLNYFSIAILVRGPWTLLMAVFMTVIYGSAARHEERKFLSGPLGEAYREYQKTTGMFFPKLF